MKTDRLASLVAVVAILGAVSGVYGAPLGTGFTYQGQLKKAGVPLNGTADLQFTLWDAAGSGNPPTGGVQIGNTQAINAHPVTDGLFTVALNPNGQFGANAFNGEARWLQIAVRSPAGAGAFTTLSPRQPLTAASQSLFALNAATATNATQLDGQGPAFYRNAANLTGTLNAARLPNPLTLSGNNVSHTIKGENASTAEGSSGVYGVSSGVEGIGVSGRSDGTSGTGVYGESSNVGVRGRGTGFQGQVRGDSRTNYGGYFESDSPSGRGVYGVAQGPPVNVSGGSESEGARGVYGEANFDEGRAYGVYGESRSNEGVGVYGQATASFGETYGGYFWSNSGSEGIGVYGLASGTPDVGLAKNAKAAALGGDTYGGYFQSLSPSGHGVYGRAEFASGTTYGVRGRVNSPDGYAGYFEGRGYFEDNVGIGTTNPDARLRVAGGNIKLDHNAIIASTGRLLIQTDTFDDNLFLNPMHGTTFVGGLGGAGDLIVLGTVGIGTGTPDNRLDVNGSISVTASPGNEMVIKNSEIWTHSTGAQDFGAGAGSHFIVASKEGASESAGVYGDGDALILWSPGDSLNGQPAAFVYVLDEDRFDGDGNPYNAGALKAYLADTGLWMQSDMRRKRDFASIDQACEKVSRISAYTYEYIPSPEDVAKGDVPKRVPGLIAQEVEKVLPEAVAINADGEYFMNYSLLVPFLVESVKELNKSLAEKQAHIEALEARLAAIESRLSVLNPAKRSSGE